MLRRITPAALDPGKHFDSFSTVRHSRKPRRTPSSYLGDRVRLKGGLLQQVTLMAKSAMPGFPAVTVECYGPSEDGTARVTYIGSAEDLIASGAATGEMLAVGK